MRDAFDPERIIRVLSAHDVDCLIVGGFGAQAHGALRQTLDIDLVPRTSADDLERLAAALRELGARLRVGGMSDDEARQLPVTVDADTLRRFVSSTWMTDAGPVDVLGELPVSGGRRGYDELAERAVPRSVHGVVVYIASLDDIIDSKEAAARGKDRKRCRSCAISSVDSASSETNVDSTLGRRRRVLRATGQVPPAAARFRRGHGSPHGWAYAMSVDGECSEPRLDPQA